MKTLALIALIVITLIATGVLFYRYTAPASPSVSIKLERSAHPKILALGDSLVAGVGATPGQDWVSVLSRKINLPIENEGHSGDSTNDALKRIPTVAATDPDIVLVLLGGNDVLQGVPKETIFKNLGTIVTTFQREGAKVIILGVRGGLFSDTLASDFERFARDHHTGYVTDVLDGFLGDNRYMSDPIHPNDAGYAMIAERVYDELLKILELD